MPEDTFGIIESEQRTFFWFSDDVRVKGKSHVICIRWFQGERKWIFLLFFILKGRNIDIIDNRICQDIYIQWTYDGSNTMVFLDWLLFAVALPYFIDFVSVFIRIM